MRDSPNIAKIKVLADKLAKETAIRQGRTPELLAPVSKSTVYNLMKKSNVEICSEPQRKTNARISAEANIRNCFSLCSEV